MLITIAIENTIAIAFAIAIAYYAWFMHIIMHYALLIHIMHY